MSALREIADDIENGEEKDDKLKKVFQHYCDNLPSIKILSLVSKFLLLPSR